MASSRKRSNRICTSPSEYHLLDLPRSERQYDSSYSTILSFIYPVCRFGCRACVCVGVRMQANSLSLTDKKKIVGAHFIASGRITLFILNITLLVTFVLAKTVAAKYRSIRK